MSNAKLLFKSIDDAADKARKAKLAKENKEFMARKEKQERVSKCSFLVPPTPGMYHHWKCKNPERTRENSDHYRDCLVEDCPLFK